MSLFVVTQQLPLQVRIRHIHSSSSNSSSFLHLNNSSSNNHSVLNSKPCSRLSQSAYPQPARSYQKACLSCPARSRMPGQQQQQLSNSIPSCRRRQYQWPPLYHNQYKRHSIMCLITPCRLISRWLHINQWSLSNQWLLNKVCISATL